MTSAESNCCRVYLSRVLTGVRRTLKLPLVAVCPVVVLGVAAALACFAARPVFAQAPEQGNRITEQGVYEELGANSDGTAHAIVMLQPLRRTAAGMKIVQETMWSHRKLAEMCPREGMCLARVCKWYKQL